MKIFTNENNTATLKILIAAKLTKNNVIIEKSSFTDKVFAGPNSLPLLVVHEDLKFFSSNTSVQYLLPLENAESGQCNQYLELEATRLYPSVQSVVSSKSVPADHKQVLSLLLKDLDSAVSKQSWLLGDKISAADVCMWSTLYPLYYNNDLKNQYLSATSNLCKWMEGIGNLDAVKDAIKEWGGSPNPPFGATSSLGLPQIPSLTSPIMSPDQSGDAEISVSQEECQLAKENWRDGLSKLQPIVKQEKVVLPVKGRKNILVTSALPYVNNVPHLGNIIGCVLSADIFARYCRLCDYNAIYICGTDEYGTATETKALEEGVTPREICDKYFALHNEVYRWFNIGFDYFGRTSTKEQTEITQKMFLKLNDNGFINTQTVDQLFCTKCERFLADRFVEGTCHHPGCLYPDARGDQCDKCGKLINAVELIQPRCKVCSSSPVLRGSVQLFLDLGALEPAVRSWASKVEANWSPPARAVAKAWLRDGLRPRAVTRDLKWGVPVPLPEYSNKVFYVWFDAPMGYMSITECATKQYEKWWKPDKDCQVQLYQFMAKDNVPFHAVMFPATLIGVNEGHVLVDHIYATEYLNYEDGKFSKSRGVGVFGSDVRDTGIEADVWRYYLASIRPETSDSSFSWIELGTRNNSELLNNLGNFCHRSLSFCERTFNGAVPEVKLEQQDLELIALVNRDIKAYVTNMEKGKLREALRNVMSISRLGNQHMQSTQPWVLLKGSEQDKERGATAIGVCCQMVSLLCTLISPYMPEVSRKLGEQLNINKAQMRINPENPSFHQYLPKGHVIGKPEPLFTKIENELLENLKKKYAGTQTDRANKENGPVSQTATGVAELEDAITKQGDVVRKLKSTTKDKSVWQPEVDKLLALKKQLTEAQQHNTTNSQTTQSVQQLETAIAQQGDVVRKLKSTTKDKSVWQPEVDKLLALKKQLTEAQQHNTTNSQTTQSVQQLETAITQQGDVVRKLKSTTKDKSVWQPEVDKLLALKKQLTEAQQHNTTNSQTTETVQQLETAIAQQGEKVRKLKASTKDKSVWQPEVAILLDLKKKLSAAQVK